MRKFLMSAAIGLSLMGICKKSLAQIDPHFSQYYMSPMWINPALTGAIDGDYRVSGLYRDQWRSFDNGFSTKGFSFDAPTDKNINLGTTILSQSAGNGGYIYTNAHVSVAYTGVRFGESGFHHVHMGISAGIINRRIDPSKFELGDQWNAVSGYNPANPTTEIFSNTSSTVFDANAGVLYFDADPDKKVNIYGGFSAAHISRSKDKFLQSSASKTTIPIRYNVHGGVRISLAENVIVVPNFMYMKQGTAEEKMLGAYFQLSANSSTDVLLGGNYRYQDAISPYMGLTFNDLTIGVSYDVNASKLGKLATGANSFELTLSYIKKRKVKASPEYIRCPRL